MITRHDHSSARPHSTRCRPLLTATPPLGEVRQHGDADRMRRSEELSIAPARERAVYVWYTPAAAAEDANAAEAHPEEAAR